MKEDADLFINRQNLENFQSNSRLQYIKLKFGNKENLINYINDTFSIKFKKNVTYDKLNKILIKNSINLYTDILEVSSSNEIAHLYSLYRTLTDTFWETTYWKTFSPIYNFIFDKDIKITRKSDLRDFAAEIVTKLSQDEFLEKWIGYTIKGGSKPVIQYGHLTIGPSGLIFSLYHREKELFGSQEPLLGCLVDSTHTGEDIVNWEKTDLFYIFGRIIKTAKLKYQKLEYSDPVYFYYLRSIGYEFPNYSNKDLSNLVSAFKNKNNEISIEFYYIVQLSALFFRDIDLIRLLNELICKRKLFINCELEIKDKNIKISKFGMVKRPEKWNSKPAFDLARDIITSFPQTENLNEILGNILKEGAIKYLEQLYDNQFQIFQLICKKRYLYEFATSNKINISKDIAINLLLECYGIQNALSPSIDIRLHLNSFLHGVNEFNENYKTMNNKTSLDETLLVDEIIKNLRDGRSYLERGLKEWLYLLCSLIIYYEEKEKASKEPTPDNFVMDRPIFYIYYDKDRELRDIKEKVSALLTELASSEIIKLSAKLIAKIDKYSKNEKSNLALGDYTELLTKVVIYIEDDMNSEIWKLLYPEKIYKNLIQMITDLNMCLNDGEAFRLMNIASHGDAVIEFHRDTELRNKSIDLIMKLDIIISNVFKSLPELITITGKISEMKTGLEYYEFVDENNVKAKIYGTRFIDFSYIYYFVPRIQEKDMVSIYPLLVADLTDIIF